MKKSNLSKILVTSLLAFGSLVGCNDTPTSSSESMAYVNGIDIYPIESAVVGETINLKDYVFVDGETTEFTAEVTSLTTASLDGYNLTVIGEGKVTVWIRAGTHEQLLEFNAISTTLNTYKEIVENLEYNFFLGMATWNSAGTDVTLSPEGHVFNEDYSATFFEAYDGDPQTYEGFIYGNNVVKFFSMDDISGTNFSVKPGDYSTLLYERSRWTLSYDLFTTEYVNPTQSYLWGDIKAADAMCTMLGYNSATNIAAIYQELLYQEGYITANDTVSMGVQINLKELPSSDGLGTIVSPVISMFVTISTGQYLDLGINHYLLTDEDSYTLDYVEEAINTNAYPEKIVPTKLFDKISEITSAKNYTLDVDLGWKNYETLADEEAPEGFETDFAVYASAMFDFDAKQYVTEDAVRYELDDGRYETYTQYTENSETKVSLTTNIDEETDEKLETPVTSEATFNGIWEGTTKPTDLINSVNNNTSAKENINVFVDQTEEEITETGYLKEYDYLVSGGLSGADFITSLINLVPFNGASLAAWYGQKLAMLSNIPMTELLNIYCYVYVNEDSLKFNMSIRWTQELSYNLIFTFSDIGTTVIPA